MSADSPTPLDATWLRSHWQEARAAGSDALFVVDEVQKVAGWAEVCKSQFDQRRHERDLKIVLLGSASLNIQEGLSSSLAGRFELIRVPHWSLDECRRAFNWDLRTYLKFGGYPAAAELINEFERWRSFLRDSVLEPVLGRDITGLVRIHYPALFRQTFRLAMQYPAQVVSYQKLLGQLQARGNAATIRHYLEFMEGAFLLRLIPKFSGSPAATVSSSPKLLPLCPALANAFVDDRSRLDDPVHEGRLLEAAVGAALSRSPGTLYYWREGHHEIDFVRCVDGEIIGYEVKSGRLRHPASIQAFERRYPKSRVQVVDTHNVESFLS